MSLHRNITAVLARRQIQRAICTGQNRLQIHPPSAGNHLIFIYRFAVLKHSLFPLSLSTGKRKFQMWYFLPPNLQLNLLSLAEAAFFRRGTRTVLCFEVTTRYNVYNAKSVRRYANLVPRSGQVSAGTRYLFFRQRKMLAKEISISTRSEFGHLSDW